MKTMAISKCTKSRTNKKSAGKSWTRSKTRRYPAETARKTLCLPPASKSFTLRKGGKTSRRDARRAKRRRKRGLEKISRSVTRTKEASAPEERIAGFRTGLNRRTGAAAAAAAAAAALRCATRIKEASAPEAIRASSRTKKAEVAVPARRREAAAVAAVVASALRF